MNYSKALSLMILTAGIAANCQAADFFSADQPDKNLKLGVHLGVNTSNRTILKDAFSVWNKDAWGTGFDLGVTADIYFRDWISVQPGLWIGSRSGSYTYINPQLEVLPPAEGETVAEVERSFYTQVGDRKSFIFTIPVLASVHFNVTDDLRWNVEVGPYLQWIAQSNDVQYPLNGLTGNDNDIPVLIGDVTTKMEKATPRHFDVGFKFGTGLTIRNHYDVAVHYMAGCMSVWNPSQLKGRNKQWSFTIGYIF